jgi:hypothetical protein
MEKNNFNQNSGYGTINKKLIHPRVLKALQRLNPPSPVAVPKDKYQPMAGYINSTHNNSSELVTPAPQKNFKEKPQPVLCLNSSLLARRKPSLNFQ